MYFLIRQTFRILIDTLSDLLESVKLIVILIDFIKNL